MDLVDYLHVLYFGTVQSTFLKAIKKGFFKSWPGLSEKLVTKNLKPSIAIAKGNISQTRQHLQSTKNTDKREKDYLDSIQKNIVRIKSSQSKTTTNSLEEILLNSINNDVFPSSDSPNIATNGVIYSIFDSSTKGLGYIDLSSRFMYKSVRGNK